MSDCAAEMCGRSTVSDVIEQRQRCYQMLSEIRAVMERYGLTELSVRPNMMIARDAHREYWADRPAGGLWQVIIFENCGTVKMLEAGSE